MTNYEVCLEFAARRRAKTGHLISNGDKLFSYNTIIGQWIGHNVCIVNYTRYSVTTSKHRASLVTALGTLYRDIKVIKISGEVPYGTYNLIPFLTDRN